MQNLESTLRNFLKLYWLRPENGLLCTFKSRAFLDIELASPSLDISCGDGLFMYLHLGGELGDDFDYFTATKAREFSHSRFVDIYDHSRENYTATIAKPAIQTIDTGTDWKQGLLDKASALNLYGSLILHDNNVTPLPFAGESYKSVYSNSIYWVRNVDAVLREVHRILIPGGVAVMEVMTPTLLSTLDRMEPLLSGEAIQILNRQRRETMLAPRTYQEWKKTITSAGLAVEDVRSVYPNSLLIDIWNIGLRPVSHLLIRMTESLSNQERQEIKREWVEIFHTLFKPLLSLPVNYQLDNAPYLCWIVRKEKA